MYVFPAVLHAWFNAVLYIAWAQVYSMFFYILLYLNVWKVFWFFIIFFNKGLFEFLETKEQLKTVS